MQNKTGQWCIQFYKKYEKFVPILSFFAGFGWDSATLQRIDQMSDNIILIIYLFLLGGFINLINFVEKGILTKTIFVKYKAWYPIIIQFLLGAFLSFLLVTGNIYFLYKFSVLSSKQQFVHLTVMISTWFIFFNLFYFMNWIPPVPLSLKFAGIFHHAKKIDVEYRLQFEKPKWYQIFKNSDNPYHYADGDTVFCFAAVFAPTKLKKHMSPLVVLFGL